MNANSALSKTTKKLGVKKMEKDLSKLFVVILEKEDSSWTVVTKNGLTLSEEDATDLIITLAGAYEGDGTLKAINMKDFKVKLQKDLPNELCELLDELESITEGKFNIPVDSIPGDNIESSIDSLLKKLFDDNSYECDCPNCQESNEMSEEIKKLNPLIKADLIYTTGIFYRDIQNIFQRNKNLTKKQKKFLEDMSLSGANAIRDMLNALKIEFTDDMLKKSKHAFESLNFCDCKQTANDLAGVNKNPTNSSQNNTNHEDTLQRAMSAFWNIVAANSPEIECGILTDYETKQIKKAMSNAIKLWRGDKSVNPYYYAEGVDVNAVLDHAFKENNFEFVPSYWKEILFSSVKEYEVFLDKLKICKGNDFVLIDHSNFCIIKKRVNNLEIATAK